MKRFFVLSILEIALAGTALLGLPMSVAAGSIPSVEIDGKVLDLKTPPVIQNGITMVPFRAFAEGLRATVNYHQGEINISQNGMTVELKVGSNEFKVNGNTWTMPAEPIMIKERMLIPARSFAETFRTKVEWVDKKIIVTTKEIITLESKELDINGTKEKISLAVEQIPDGTPLNWRIMVGGKERVRIQSQENFTLARLDFEDIDNDGNMEILLYRYCTGSSGAVQLNIFDPEKNLAQIFEGENTCAYVFATDGKFDELDM